MKIFIILMAFSVVACSAKYPTRDMECMRQCIGAVPPPDQYCHNLMCTEGLYPKWKTCEAACHP